jgi:hypothetical protein
MSTHDNRSQPDRFDRGPIVRGSPLHRLLEMIAREVARTLVNEERPTESRWPQDKRERPLQGQ